MGGDHAVSRPAGRRGWVLGFVVGLAVALGGCTLGVPREGEPDAVDEARADALRADTWLAPTSVELTRYAEGTDGLYHPTTAEAVRPVAGTAAETVMAEVAASREVGWWPYYGRCPGSPAPRDRTADYFFDTDLVVLLARELDDGSMAQAALRLADDELTVTGTAANHTKPGQDPPPEVDLSELACVGGEAAGAPTIGTAVDLTGPGA